MLSQCTHAYVSVIQFMNDAFEKAQQYMTADTVAYTGDDILAEGKSAAGSPGWVLLCLALPLLTLQEGLLLGRRLGAMRSSLANHACCIASLKVCKPIIYHLVPAPGVHISAVNTHSAVVRLTAMV